MAELTAQILIGRLDRQYQDKKIRNYMFLSENDKPAWILTDVNLMIPSYGLGDQKSEIIWIPTVEDMLEDAFLMIGIYIVQDPNLIKAVNERAGKNIKRSKRVLMYDVFEKEKREELYRICRDIKNFPRLELILMEDSNIERQIRVIKYYQMEIVVYGIKYSRLYSPWNKKMNESGSLENPGTRPDIRTLE